MRQEGEALTIGWRKEFGRLGPVRKSRAVAVSDERGGKERRKEENDKISAKPGQSLGDSWPNRERRVNACFGRFAQNEVFLETAGFVSRDFQDPRRKRKWSWLAEEDVRDEMEDYMWEYESLKSRSEEKNEAKG